MPSTSLALAAAQTLVAFALHFVALSVAGEFRAGQFVMWMMRVRPSLVWGEFMGVFFYWMVVAVATALRFRDLYAAERLSAAELAARSATLEGQLARAQLDALRSQLRPHFLFNTLNAISVLTLEDAARARHMVVRLGSLLRRSLDEEEHEVPLRQELVFLDDYLDIQRARFGDRLVVTLDVDNGAADARVPVLLLQPLVENAIEHGWPEKDATTSISLRADAERRRAASVGRGQRTGRGRRGSAARGHRALQHARAAASTLRRPRRDATGYRARQRRGERNARRDHDSLLRVAGMRVLIVDDEPLARRGLRRELDRMPDTTCIGECATRDEAVLAIRAGRPDLVLLDVQLGRATGFEVIERVGADAMPLVVFVTAYDRHALRAFEVHAVDYVLKPVDPDRLRDAIDRAMRLRTLERGASLAERLERLLAGQASPACRRGAGSATPAGRTESPCRRASVARSSTCRPSIGSRRTAIMSGCTPAGARHLLRSTMARMEQRLGASNDVAARFIRIRRSALVNVQAIATVEPYGKGMFLVTLRDGSRLVSSRYHQAGLRRLLKMER